MALRTFIPLYYPPDDENQKNPNQTQEINFYINEFHEKPLYWTVFFLL